MNMAHCTCLLLSNPKQPDVALVTVQLLALLNFPQHLGGVSAPKHGLLPHGPVSSIVVPGHGAALTVDTVTLVYIASQTVRKEVNNRTRTVLANSSAHQTNP